MDDPDPLDTIALLFDIGFWLGVAAFIAMSLAVSF
jgi:hypothetical protein